MIDDPFTSIANDVEASTSASSVLQLDNLQQASSVVLDVDCRIIVKCPRNPRQNVPWLSIGLPINSGLLCFVESKIVLISLSQHLLSDCCDSSLSPAIGLM